MREPSEKSEQKWYIYQDMYCYKIHLYIKEHGTRCNILVVIYIKQILAAQHEELIVEYVCRMAQRCVMIQRTLVKQASRAATYIFSFFSRSFLFSSSCWAEDLTFTRPCCQKQKEREIQFTVKKIILYITD